MGSYHNNDKFKKKDSFTQNLSHIYTKFVLRFGTRLINLSFKEA